MSRQSLGEVTLLLAELLSKLGRNGFEKGSGNKRKEDIPKFPQNLIYHCLLGQHAARLVLPLRGCCRSSKNDEEQVTVSFPLPLLVRKLVP